MSGIEVVEAFMSCMYQGDISGALHYVHADVAIVEPRSMPYGGNYSGHAGFTDVMGRINQTWASWRESPNQYAESEGMVFRETTIRSRLRKNGRVVEMPFVEVFEVDGELIRAIRPHYFDPSLLHESDST